MRVKPKTKVFLSSMTDSIVPIVRRMNDAGSDDAGASLMASLFGEPEPKRKAGQPKLSRDEHFATKMFRSFREIHTCIERLKDCQTYVSRFPFNGTRVTRSAYLQCMVEVHLHEIYTLHERLQAWLTQIARAYKSDTRGPAVKKLTDLLSARTTEMLRPLLGVRGQHVHEWRYHNPDISRLELIDLLASSPSDDFSKAIKILRRSATNETHRRLKRQAQTWNSLTFELLELVLSHLSQVLFSNDGKSFLYPNPQR